MEPIIADDDCDTENEDKHQHSNINFSDIIDVIKETDPSFEAAVQQINTEMFSGGGALPGPSKHVNIPQRQQTLLQQIKEQAFVRIVEQPASKALRFRYECEGRSAGSIPGVHSTPENKTYPTIEIVGYKGRAVVVVSCVTKDLPYRPHPHNLVGKEGCKKGVCTVEINSDSMSVSFSNLGIQCVKKKDIEESLKIREEIRVDPYKYKTNFPHRSQSQPSSIDLNSVRLCFQVFLEGSEKGRFTLALEPVVSDPIFDKKAMSDLVICKMSHCSAPVAGGREVILLCEKVAKEDISIRFYEEQDGQIVWEGWGDFQHANVHKQVAIAFRTPRYRSIEVDQPVKVYMQLRRPSDGALSEPLPFELIPLDSDPVKRKRQKFDTDVPFLRNLQPPMQDIASMDPLAQLAPGTSYNIFNIPIDQQTIKLEPREQTPSPYNPGQGGMQYGMYRTIQGSPSPQHYPTPSPPLDYNTNMAFPVPIPAMPSNIPILQQQQQHHEEITEHSTLSSLLNMDTQNMTQLNSSEYNLASLLEGAYQPSAQQLMDNTNREQENMTDSFTKLLQMP